MGAHLKEFSDKDIGVMIQDCEFQANMNMFGDVHIDKPGWLKWAQRVQEEAKRRENAGRNQSHAKSDRENDRA